MKSIIHSVYYSSSPIKSAVHHHDCHQILYIVSGQATAVINGKEREIKKGSLLILSRFEEHYVKKASEDYCRYVLRIKPDAQYTGDIKLFSLLFNRPVNFNNMIFSENDGEKIEYIFLRIIQEYGEENGLRENMIDLLVNELFIFLYRHTEFDTKICDDPVFDTVVKVQNILSSNFAEDFSLKELSLSLAVSPSFLSHGFKKVTGMSVMSYLLACRIAEAKKRLARTDKPIGTVAEECGFSDFSNFSRIFKRTVGMSPSEYAKKYRV